jgi:type IV pilus assembly protein PilW
MEQVKKMRIKQNKNLKAGFTLLEILIAICISSFVLGGIYMTYSSQQKAYISSDQTAEMQQNLQAAMLVMDRDIREAGCDPTLKANAGFLSATIGQLRFTRDIAGHAVFPNQSDGDTSDTNEDIIFGFSAADDANGNGIVDGGGADWSVLADLSRDTTGTGLGFRPIAERMAAVEFNYILEDNTTRTAPSTSELGQIKAVQISLMTKARLTDEKLPNNISYKTASGATWGPFNDNYRRRFVSTTIECRNLGLK